MQVFKAIGPFEITLRDTNGHLSIDAKSPFKDQEPPEVHETGCYVFTRRTPRGHTPIYVGKTERNTLLKEAFNPGNRNSVCEQFARFRKYKSLHLWLLVAEKRRGRPSTKNIAEVEKFLIQLAVRENPDLLNVHHAKEKDKWRIKGVHKSGRGEASKTTSAFRRMIGLGLDRLSASGG